MEPNRECPRFQRCSVNNCPLDSGYPDYDTSPLDKERKCTFSKARRILIAVKYPGVLKYGGRTKAEYSAFLAYEQLSSEDKIKLAELGKKSLKLVAVESKL